jgi:hypothetical protein
MNLLLLLLVVTTIIIFYMLFLKKKENYEDQKIWKQDCPCKNSQKLQNYSQSY